MKGIRRVKFASLLGLALLSVSGAAYAATPSTDQYGNPLSGVQDAGGAAPEAGIDAVGTTGTLPFTGLPLALIVAAGLLLVAVGLYTRRRGSRNLA